jgi:hypothetical protein
MLTLGVLVAGLVASVSARVTRPEIRLSDAAARTLLSASDHTYKVHEKVPLYANKVGPFHNPSEVRRGAGCRRVLDGAWDSGVLGIVGSRHGASCRA